MSLSKQIESLFNELGLSLTMRGQILSRRESAKLTKLKAIIPAYEKETRIPVRCKCQNQINEFIAILQVYYSKNKPFQKTKVNDNEK